MGCSHVFTQQKHRGGMGKAGLDLVQELNILKTRIKLMDQIDITIH